MPKYIDVESAAYDYETLYDWFISSVGPEPPVWTDGHIKELEDFYVVPKSTPAANVVVLPCEVGDMVYYRRGENIIGDTVRRIVLDEHGNHVVLDCHNKEFDFEDFGTKAFTKNNN